MSPHVLKLKEKYRATNVTPVWLLIYWRLVNDSQKPDYARAYLRLADHLPKGIKMPTADEVAINLALHKLV